jgi:hypothetical protein
MNYLNRMARLAAAALASVCVVSAMAEVTAEEAAQLRGPKLTLWGAEKAGNAEGTIPAYTGNPVKTPPTWNPKNPGQRPDPYGEKPLFTITAQNAAQYADKLDGMVEIFKRFPDFRMNIYPSHRDWVFPQYVLDNTVKNATSCTAVGNELKLVGCYGGIPFPLASTGNQMMWNHLLTYYAWNIKGRVSNWIVPANGEPVMVEQGTFDYNWPYYDPRKTTTNTPDALYMQFHGKDEAPARLAGGQMLVHDAVDTLHIPRSAWLYMSGRRWTKIAAELAYDTPNPYTGGTATMDDSQGFTGAQDRFDFKLIGKKEKFIYYNNFDLANKDTCPREKLTATKNFPNPDCIRWELHRVFKVESALKSGSSHLYKKRVFYWDEDGYAAGQAEMYDSSGKLYRFNNLVSYPFYETPGGFGLADFFMEMTSGTYTVTGIANCADCGWWPINKQLPKEMFSPEGMAGAGVR